MPSRTGPSQPRQSKAHQTSYVATTPGNFSTPPENAGQAIDLLAAAGGGGGDTHPIADSTAIVKDPADATKLLRMDVGGNTSGVTGVLATAFTTAKTLTFPDATDTLVAKNTTDLLKNKTFENCFVADGHGLVIGHNAQIDFGATPEFQVLGTGTSDASMGFGRFENIAAGPDVRFLKSRGAAIGDNVIVQDDDTLGRIRFQAADGGDFNTTAAQISAEVDGTPGLNDIPGRLIFTTRIAGGALTEKVRITEAGNVGIGVTNPIVKLHVVGFTLLGGDVVIGLGAAGVDYTLTFFGETNSGILTWMEDEDYFEINGVRVADISSAMTFTNKSISGEQINSGTLPIARIANNAVTRDKVEAELRTRMSDIHIPEPAAGMIVILKSTSHAITITDMHHEHSGGTNVVWNVENRSRTDKFTAGSDIWASDKTSSATGASLGAPDSDATIDADRCLVLVITSVSGSVDHLAIDMEYTID